MSPAECRTQSAHGTVPVVQPPMPGLACLRRAARVAARTILVLGTAGPAMAAAQPALEGYVEPACPQWTVPARFTLVQTNGPQVTFELSQAGPALSGQAHYESGSGRVAGHVEGSLVGTGFQARVFWTDSGRHSIGNYHGTVQSLGIFGRHGQTGTGAIYEGLTYDEYVSPRQPAGWRLSGLSCTFPLPSRQLGRVKAPGPVGFGRVGPPSTAHPPICDVARSARARNSPAAPGLERQCLASGGSMTAPDTSAPAPSPPETAPTRMPIDDTGPAPGDGDTQLDGLAATGASIANHDPGLANARSAEPGDAYRRGFDIATGLFGDPAQGAAGRAAGDATAAGIRAGLDAEGQRGFDASSDYWFD